MKSSKWCNLNLNSSDIKRVHITGELKELFEVRTFKEFKDEISDVLYFTYCFVQLKYHVNLPMLGAMSTVNKIIDRLKAWEEIFKKNNLKFNKEYLVNGSNYMKKEKVDKALSLANKDQSTR